ncbi:MAG: alpha-glucuronidase [Muribaculaceae bacterium]|nr:alpha-glucuronidase [Muribaculaceae bacterium]
MKPGAIFYTMLALVCVACGADKPAGESCAIAAEYLAEHYPGTVSLDIDTADTALSVPDAFRVRREADGSARVTSPSEAGLLYGACALVRMSAQDGTAPLDTVEVPAYSLRVLNHWDNLDGTVERGYAGRSIWKWDELPDKISPQYADYAMRCAEVGINGAVLNNVNASPRILSSDYLEKVKAIADVLRPYGIRTYLSVNFASPMALDSLPTADPLDPAVRRWWSDKADEIYDLIPDFGGFLVKANSEGQPGPCDFGRSHAEGANMLAEALRPHGGIVMWRAFVYSPADADRAKQAYLEFQPLDGSFADNVILQIKNGPVDFQPREPYSPLFGAMPATPQMAELQITQEYLGHSNHVAYLAPMWQEFFSYVDPASLVAVAGVANVGDSECLTGNPVADANWYAFGRMAWNPRLSPAQIADEWTARSLYADAASVPDSVRAAVRDMLLASREAVVDYMMPLGLHHLFAFGHHYGPEPWCDVPGARPDWLPRYYHRADRVGIGFDRTSGGSNAVAQYPDSLYALFNNIDSCPEEFLLWFHHAPWTHRMRSGRTLWDELCYAYDRGVRTVDGFIPVWEAARPYLKPGVYEAMAPRLRTQAADARWWRDACLLYFAQFSRMPLPAGIEAPSRTLEEYMKVQLPISNFECPSDSLLNLYR